MHICRLVKDNVHWPFATQSGNVCRCCSLALCLSKYLGDQRMANVSEWFLGCSVTRGQKERTCLGSFMMKREPGKQQSTSYICIVSISVYLDGCRYTYIYMYIHMYVFIPLYLYMYKIYNKYMFVHIRIHMYLYIYIDIYTFIYIYTCIYLCISMYLVKSLGSESWPSPVCRAP